MKPSTPAKWLDDIRDACGFIIELTANRTGEEFASDRLFRQGVERNIEIIGEALLRVERSDSTLASQISDIRSIIGLRNRLAHGYDDIQSVPRMAERYARRTDPAQYRDRDIVKPV